MTSLPILLLSLALVALSTEAKAAADIAGPGRERTVQLAQMTIEQRVIIRIPMMRRPMPGGPGERLAPDASPPVRWIEHDGPRCVKIKRLVGAAITSPRGIDLMLHGGGKRLRAHLGRGCRPADLYSGFYIQPTEDGDLCAGRDRLLARSGADCEIKELLRLEPDH